MSAVSLEDERQKRRQGNGNPAPVANVTDWNKVSLKRIRWMLKDRLPIGEMTVVEGPGGLGKTTMLLDIAARYSNGDDMPDGTPGMGIPGDVVLIADEDAAYVLKARLMAAGADMSHVHHLAGFDGQRFSLPSDGQKLLTFARDTNAGLIIIDALFSHFDDKLSSIKSEDVRKVLGPLSGIAHILNAVVTATRHWGKGARDAASRGLGSTDITNVARSVLAVGRDPQDESGNRIVAVAKSNLGTDPKLVPSMTFRLVLDTVRAQTPEDEDVEITRVAWGVNVSTTADELANAIAETPEDRAKVVECAAEILAMIANGPLPKKQICKSLRAEYSQPTIDRAKKRARIQTVADSTDARAALWCLPGA